MTLTGSIKACLVHVARSGPHVIYLILLTSEIGPHSCCHLLGAYLFLRGVRLVLWSHFVWAHERTELTLRLGRVT
jgi:hypothetical protein